MHLQSHGEPKLAAGAKGTGASSLAGWGLGNLPDTIRLFRGPLTRMCEDREDLREEVVITVVHEIAHHFGIDEQALHDLGWG